MQARGGMHDVGPPGENKQIEGGKISRPGVRYAPRAVPREYHG